MTIPAGVKVATDALRNEAGVWVQQGAQMAAIAAKVDDLRFKGVEAGVFLLIVDPYKEVVDQVHARTAEATPRMNEISDALRKVAATYEAEEISGAHQLK